GAWFGSAGMHFRVDRLVSEARDPLHAHVEIHGGLMVSPHARPNGGTEIAFENVAVTATSDGHELARLGTWLRPRGRGQVHAEGSGPLANLHACAIVSGPRGSLTVDGVLARGEILRWGATVLADGLDPGADWHDVPRGTIDFALHAAGAGKRGEVT